MSFEASKLFSSRQKLILLVYAIIALLVSVVVWPISSSPAWYVFPGVPIALLFGGLALITVFAQND